MLITKQMDFKEWKGGTILFFALFFHGLHSIICDGKTGLILFSRLMSD